MDCFCVAACELPTAFAEEAAEPPAEKVQPDNRAVTASKPGSVAEELHYKRSSSSRKLTM
jgi:hypothetical protein